MIAGSQVQGAKDSRKSDGIKQLLQDWHGIPIRLGLLVNWAVILAHLLLRPIAKDIIIQWHNRSTNILPVGKFHRPCCQELSAASLDVNPLKNTEPIRASKNKMRILQLNVDRFSFIAFEILKVKSKTPTIRTNEHLYLLCLGTSEMRG